MSLCKIHEDDGLMVGDPVAETPDPVEAAMNFIALHESTIGLKGSVQAAAPQGGVVAWTKKGDPETQGEFGYNRTIRL